MGAASITEVSFQEIPVTVEEDNQTEMKVVKIIHQGFFQGGGGIRLILGFGLPPLGMLRIIVLHVNQSSVYKSFNGTNYQKNNR